MSLWKSCKSPSRKLCPTWENADQLAAFRGFSAGRPSYWGRAVAYGRLRLLKTAVPDLALLLSIVHQVFLSRETSTVNNLHQF